MDFQERLSSVYAIRCKADGKMYIGISKDVETRILTHTLPLNAGKRCPKFVHSALIRALPKEEAEEKEEFYKQLTIDDWEAYILEENIPYEQRKYREAYWMNYYKTKDIEYGFNFRHPSPPIKKIVILTNQVPPKRGEN